MLAQRQKKSAVIVGVILFALLSGAFFVLENFSGRFSGSLGRVAMGVLSPGWLLTTIASGNVHAGFGAGDWRDFIMMVVGSWVVWMAPVFLICRARSKKNEKEPNQTPEPTAPSGRGSS